MKSITGACGNALPVFPGMEGKSLPCPGCGKPLTVPAADAPEEKPAAPPAVSKKPFGEIAVECGFATAHQVREVIRRQRELAMARKSVLLGQVMVQQNSLP